MLSWLELKLAAIFVLLLSSKEQKKESWNFKNYFKYNKNINFVLN